MDDQMKKSLEVLANAGAQAEKELLASTRGILEALQGTLATFDKNRKEIREEMKRGSRQTTHRISL